MTNTTIEKQMLQTRKRDLETIKKKIQNCKTNAQKAHKRITECNRKISTLEKQYAKEQNETKAKILHGKIVMAKGSLHSAERTYNSSLSHVEYWQNEYNRAKSMPINQKYYFKNP